VRDPEPHVLRAAMAGDLDAFDVLVRTFQEPVWRYLCAMVRDHALAEDLAQETFLRAYGRLSTFAFRSRFSTWLFTIARNLAIDALRQRERRAALLVRLAPSGPSPSDAPLRAEVDAAVASLSTKLRDALVLVEVMGFSCHEAGEILGVPEGTIKSRLFHARARLVAWFDEPGVSEVGP
jgi:RNA polymerase sigma-70 factor, ECF subfamily